MKPIRKKWLFGISIAILLTLLGFTREFVFENMNAQLYKLWYGLPEYHLPSSLGFMNSWEADTLYYLKYPLTLLTVLLYYIIAQKTIHFYFHARKLRRISLYTHGFILLIGGAFYLYGVVFNDFDQGYKFSRIFMDFLQSPLLLMILLPACKLLETTEN